MFCSCYYVRIMRWIDIGNDSYRPTELEELIKGGEVHVPRAVPPLDSIVLKMSYVGGIYLCSEMVPEWSIQEQWQ